MDAVAICTEAGTVYLEARRATFGGGYLTDAAPLTPVRTQPWLADSALENAQEFANGNSVALALRGTVNFVAKARVAQRAGAAGLIVLNTEVENFVPNAPEDDDASDVSIPVICVSAAHSDELLAIADGTGPTHVAFLQTFTSVGLLFSARNLRTAIEDGDEAGARSALENRVPHVSRWSSDMLVAPGSFDPLVWSAELPAGGRHAGTYSSHGSPPFFVASYLGHEAIVRLLLTVLPALEPQQQRERQASSLLHSQEAQHPTVPSTPTSTNAADAEAAPGSCPNVVHEAWSEGQTNADGWTPLIAASWLGHAGVVTLLTCAVGGVRLVERARSGAGGTPVRDPNVTASRGHAAMTAALYLLY